MQEDFDNITETIEGAGMDLDKMGLDMQVKIVFPDGYEMPVKT